MSRHPGWQAQRSSSGCTGYDLRAWRLQLLSCSHPSSARERLLSRRWFGTSCSLARRRSETALGAIRRQRRDRGIAGVPACSGRTVASASVPRRLSEKKRSLFSDIHHLPVDQWAAPRCRGQAVCRSVIHKDESAHRALPSPPRAPSDRPHGTPARVWTAGIRVNLSDR